MLLLPVSWMPWDDGQWSRADTESVEAQPLSPPSPTATVSVCPLGGVERHVAVKGDGTKGDPGCNNNSQEFLSAVSWHKRFIHFLGHPIQGRDMSVPGKWEVFVLFSCHPCLLQLPSLKPEQAQSLPGNHSIDFYCKYGREVTETANQKSNIKE